MGIQIGHAVMDELGKTIGLTPGDQTRKEIALAIWYAKNKAGRVWKYYLECTDPDMAERAARYMEQICADDSFGYSQGKAQRWEGFRSIKANGGIVFGARGDFDCSSLVISCYILAGLNMAPTGYTGDMRTRLMATGKFKSYSDSAHLSTGRFAKRGGVYLRDGHTLMALEDGNGVTDSGEAADLKVVGKIVVDEINKWCNVRSGPGMEYTIIGKARKNDVFDIYGVVEDWYQIDYNGSVGYLFGDLASEVLPGNL